MHAPACTRSPPVAATGCFGYKDCAPALLIGLVLLVLLPHPWNGVGFAAATAWAILGILVGLWWSKREAPLVGTNVLVGQRAVVVESCKPRGLVKIRGETWQARSHIGVEPGERVRVCSVDGLMLYVEPEQAI
jgi:membrane protein implicated in regulation of membrane protease activity